MGECIFENAGNVLFDSYPIRKKLKRSLNAKTTYINEELFGVESNYFVHAELSYFDRILQKHYDGPIGTGNETIEYTALDAENDMLGFPMNTKPQYNLQEADSQLLQKLQQNKVNLVLVATSLDESDVVQKLKGSLDPETSSMIPLVFDEKNNAVDQEPSSEPASPNCESNTDFSETSEENDPGTKQLCSRKARAQLKDEKYWKRRTNNNEAAKRSREAKRARFVWIENRTKELDVENENLHQQLKRLEHKVLEMEKKSLQDLIAGRC